MLDNLVIGSGDKNPLMDDKTKKKVEDLVYGVLNDRYLCAYLKINYNKPTEDDVKKAKEYAKTLQLIKF